ncbi:MAG: DUF2169 domain-containing protein [Nibricoccus sp.]
MFQVDNKTPFEAKLALLPNPEGVECAYGIVKASFGIGADGKLRALEKQLPIALSDSYWGDPIVTSLKQAGEVTLAKPSTDILLCGHAYAPRAEATAMDVRLAVAEVVKTLRVFGDRAWQCGFFGWKPSAPKPFEKIPLRWEFAFGGTVIAPEDENNREYEPCNPVGRGLLPKCTKAEWEGRLLPNLEDPRTLIAGPKDRPAPACFAPVCPYWEPRKAYAGTYNEVWRKQRAPYLPKDFDSRFLQVAPRDLITPKYFKGGEPVEVVGATPGAPLRFKLPDPIVDVAFHFNGTARAEPVNLDTVCIEPDERRMSLVWRSCLVVDKKPHALSAMEVRLSDAGRRYPSG